MFQKRSHMGAGARPKPRWLYLLYMDKAEILHRLKTTRQLNTNGTGKDWKEAFEAHKKATGLNLSMKCGKCFATVREWLQA